MNMLVTVRQTKIAAASRYGTDGNLEKDQDSLERKVMFMAFFEEDTSVFAKDSLDNPELPPSIF